MKLVLNHFFSSSVLLGTRHVYDALAQKYVVFYRDRTAQKAYAKAGTFNSSDNTITWESTQTLVLNEDMNPTTATYDTNNNKPIVGIKSSSASSIGYAHVFTTGRIGTNLTATNYIGIAGEAISNGATGKVTIFGGTNSRTNWSYNLAKRIMSKMMDHYQHQQVIHL